MSKKTKKIKEVVLEVPKKKKAKKKLYFDMDVQDAIVRYNALDPDKDQAARNQIYGEEIHTAFDKLCENIINTFKFTYFNDLFEDVKTEVVSFLVINLHKYDHTKGSKAFSYFSVVAKNYLILHNNANYKKVKVSKDIDDLGVRDKLVSPPANYTIGELTNQLIEYFDKNIVNIFKKKRDLKIAYAILELLKKRDEIENFNKKALYILIREMTDVNTANITSVVNVFKRKYERLHNEFFTKGYIDVGHQNKFF